MIGRSSRDAGREFTQLVRSNPRVLAAAVLTHLPRGAKVVGLAGSNPRGRELHAEIGFEVGSVRVDLVVGALNSRSVGEASCGTPHRLRDCTDVTLADGTRVLSGTHYEPWVQCQLQRPANR